MKKPLLKVCVCLCLFVLAGCGDGDDMPYDYTLQNKSVYPADYSVSALRNTPMSVHVKLIVEEKDLCILDKEIAGGAYSSPLSFSNKYPKLKIKFAYSNAPDNWSEETIYSGTPWVKP